MIFPVLALGLWLIARPSADQLGIQWKVLTKKQKLFTAGSGSLVMLLLVLTLFLFPDMMLINLVSALLFPIFEELLFRGWIWSKLETILTGPHSGLMIWIATSVLFAIWHLGYSVTVTQNAGPSANPLEIMFFKVLVGGMVGVIAGLARWRELVPCWGRYSCMGYGIYSEDDFIHQQFPK